MTTKKKKRINIPKNVTFKPDNFNYLEDLITESGDDNRSRVLNQIITEHKQLRELAEFRTPGDGKGRFIRIPA